MRIILIQTFTFKQAIVVINLLWIKIKDVLSLDTFLSKFNTNAH